MTADERNEATLLIKKCLDAGDPAPFVQWFEAQRDKLDFRAEIAELVKGERARLIKIRSLGATGRIDTQIALLEQFLLEAQSR